MSIDKTFESGFGCEFEFIVEWLFFSAVVLAACMHASEGWVRRRIAFDILWSFLTVWRVFQGPIMGKDDEIAVNEVEEDARDKRRQPYNSSAVTAAVLDRARSRFRVFDFAGVNACLRACLMRWVCECVRRALCVW